MLVKNEGALLAVVFFVAVLLIAILTRIQKRSPCFKQTLFLLAGILPFLGIRFLFQQNVILSNELFTSEIFSQLWNVQFLMHRGSLIAKAFLGQIFQENAWVYSWIFAGLAISFYVKGVFRARPLLTVAIVILLWNAGYFLIYLITPLDLNWHLATSLDRLLIHSFPVTVWLAFEALFS